MRDSHVRLFATPSTLLVAAGEGQGLAHPDQQQQRDEHVRQIEGEEDEIKRSLTKGEVWCLCHAEKV